jgi:2-keto-4-pentenoate hydratase/2-oxohepta-3-ene-1,7-dioic acid hydratase in catechol pathway
MKVCTFTADGQLQLGIVKEDAVISISAADPGLATDMVDLIARWAELESVVQQIDGPSFALSSVRLLPPILRPGKILALGLNYADHVAESGMALPDRQTWFCKQATSVNGPFEPIVLPKVSSALDYEIELVVVIGKGGRHITPEKARECIFGYCVGNDVSVRDYQLATSQWMLGKSFDTHAPFGPWITTSDEVPDPHALEIRCSVNGEERQRSNTKNFIFRVWDQVAHLSQVMTLEPGDLLFTGTPGGVGWAMTPPRLLKAGDTVKCMIEKLGSIENSVIQEK